MADPPPSDAGTSVAQARAEAALLETMVRAHQRLLASGERPDAVVTALCEMALEAIAPAEGAVVETREGDDLFYRHAAGTALPHVGLRFPIAESLSGRCLAERRLLVTADAQRDARTNRPLVTELDIRSAMVVPLFRRGEALGVLKLYAGGEDNFCHRVSRTSTGQYGEFGILDRKQITAQKVQTVLCETPTVIEGHAFTTGKIKRNSVEKILPNSFVDYTPASAGCDYGHYTPAELQGKFTPDEQALKCMVAADAFAPVPNAWGKQGWTTAILSRLKIAELRAALEMAYQHALPKAKPRRR